MALVACSRKDSCSQRFTASPTRGSQANSNRNKGDQERVPGPFVANACVCVPRLLSNSGKRVHDTGEKRPWEGAAMAPRKMTPQTNPDPLSPNQRPGSPRRTRRPGGASALGLSSRSCAISTAFRRRSSKSSNGQISSAPLTSMKLNARVMGSDCQPQSNLTRFRRWVSFKRRRHRTSLGQCFTGNRILRRYDERGLHQVWRRGGPRSPWRDLPCADANWKAVYHRHGVRVVHPAGAVLLRLLRPFSGADATA